MFTERFNKLRKKALEDVFSKDNLIKTWREIVRNNFRNSPIRDIYDCYDFNYHIEDRATSIRKDILAGTYKVSAPLIFKSEKKYGICRHLIMPQPIDALVMQVIVESLSSSVLKKQPSKKAFFSRDRHTMKSSKDLAEDYLPRFSDLWKRMQKEIYEFSEEKEYLVTTDLLNFYDSIDIYELKKIFMGIANADEVAIDLLFRIVEEISWKPDYLPYSNRGLPTSNIEGIRLLAHSMLFELDEVLKQRTDDHFVRWMDDITFGVGSYKEAVETLSCLSDILKSRGLALSIAKTEIYAKKEGIYHFQTRENAEINEIESIKIENKTDEKTVNNLFTIFLKEHLKDRNPKYWEKITKRLITNLTKVKSNSLLKYYKNLYLSYPNLRPFLIRYLLSIGFNKKTSSIVIETLNELNIFDDITLSQLCYLVIDWEIPINSEAQVFLKTFETTLKEISISRGNPFDFYCVIIFKTKYSHWDDLYDYITKYSYVWESDTFLRRQVISVLPRIYQNKDREVEELLYHQISSGVPNTISVTNSILFLSKTNILDQKLNSYLFTRNSLPRYPLSKFLILCNVLKSTDIRNNQIVRNKILTTISDPFYLKWLEVQFNIY